MMYYILFAILSALVLVGLSLQSKVKTAVRGNFIAMLSMALAILIVVFQYRAIANVFVWASILIGTVIGLLWAKRVKMIEMPQTVAALNGIGGLASAMVGGFELVKPAGNSFVYFTAALALVIGAVTFSGSMIAALKLAGKINSRPTILKKHGLITCVLLVAIVFGLVLAACKQNISALCVVLIASSVFGIVFAVRVGGADMPVAISLLNSLSGVAGAIAGMAIYNVLLVAVGGIIGSSGLLLTQIMCRAMNRNLMDILLGATVQRTNVEKSVLPDETTTQQEEQDDVPVTCIPLTEAKDVIIVPGYGMALSQAQHKVKELENALESRGATVRYAIHPVAGRMPGHMNVLLCEADVDYDVLYELDAINDDFQKCDAVVVVGASDVMNPAAREAEGTPIYGMPILNVDEAPNVFVCNFDLRPGYAGVENPLYSRKHGLRLLLGDAKDSIQILLDELSAEAI